MARIYEDVTTLKLQGITLKKVSGTDDFEFEINAGEIIPVLKTLRSKNGSLKGRVSPIATPTDKITHLFYAVLPVKTQEDE